jgi:hypothetical protein
MTPGGESAFFPTVSRQRLGYVGVHTDTNMWSVGIDASTGKGRGRSSTSDPRHWLRPIISRCLGTGTRSAYFAAGSSGVELRVRDMPRGTDAIVDREAAAVAGFP